MGGYSEDCGVNGMARNGNEDGKRGTHVELNRQKNSDATTAYRRKKRNH